MDYSEVVAISNNSYAKFKDLLSAKGVNAKEDPAYPGLFILKHSQSATGDLTDLVRSTKGLVGRIDNLHVVAPAVPIPIETDGTNYEPALMKCTENGVQSVQATDDGVLFRIYYHNDRWNISTNGMLYPSKGWRGTRSFADLFYDSLPPLELPTILDTKYCYYVMMVHPEHHNVVRYSVPKLIMTQIATVTETGGVDLPLTEFAAEIVRLNSVIGRTWFIDPTVDLAGTALSAFLTASELMTVVTKPVTFVGYVVTDNKGNRYRFESASFQRARVLRGNTPDTRKMWVSYVQDPAAIAEYLEFFPEDKSSFDTMDAGFNRLWKVFYSQYGHRFKLGKHVVHHSRHVKAMSELHEIYNARRKEGQPNESARITEDDVKKFLITKPAAELFYLINPDNIPPTFGYARTSTRPTTLVFE